MHGERRQCLSLPVFSSRAEVSAMWRINWPRALFAGVWAGVIATGAQLVFWWMAGRPVLETLFRDARLTAAIAMGPDVLPPPSTAQWDVMLVATVIHFALSVTYALLPAGLYGRLNGWLGPLAGPCTASLFT